MSFIHGKIEDVFTIATANVNGIRAAYRRGMQEWLEATSPDVLLLQEVRASADILADLIGGGWNIAGEACEIKGRAGVAILSKLPPTEVRTGIEGPEPAVDTGRWIEADFGLASGPITVVSAYLHSGQADTPKMDQKYAHLDKVTRRLAQLNQEGARVVIGGDINIAHREVDIKNWKGNLKTAGFLPQERAYLDRWFGEMDWVDLGRKFGGDGPGPYTWWSWRGQAFVNDAGWRIDYQIATPELAKFARQVRIDRAPSYEERWSDHAPLLVDYEI